ncbi:MAG: hypothetical protein QXR53_01700 [Candidatus Norongarragalinales archaeon]
MYGEKGQGDSKTPTFWEKLENYYYGVCDWLENKGLRVYEWFIYPLEDRGIPSLNAAIILFLGLVLTSAFFLHPPLPSREVSSSIEKNLELNPSPQTLKNTVEKTVNENIQSSEDNENIQSSEESESGQQQEETPEDVFVENSEEELVEDTQPQPSLEPSPEIDYEVPTPPG